MPTNPAARHDPKPDSKVPSTTPQPILRVAARLFRERGFHATSLENITHALNPPPAAVPPATSAGGLAGLAHPQLSTKDDLLWAIALDASQRFFAMLEPIAAADFVIPKKLREAIRGHVRVITDDLDAAAVFSSEWRHLSDARRREFVDRRDRYESLMVALLQTGTEQGHFALADARYAALMMLSTLNSVYQWFRPDGRLSADEVAQMLADFIFDGLKRRTA